MKEKVLQALKPRAASLGFTKEELESVVDSISGTLQEDATEEQINAQVDAVIPFLKLSQSAATRIVNAKKEKTQKETETSPEVKKVSDNPEAKKDEEAPAWAKAMMQEIADLKGDKVIKSRQERFNETIKDLSEKQKEMIRLTFKPASYQNDDSFEEDIQKIQSLLPELVQEQSNNGLKEMGKPVKGGTTSKEASDEEVKQIINKMDL